MFFIYNPFHAHLFFSLVKVSVNLLSNLIPKHYLTCTVQTKKKLKSSLSVFLHQDGLSLSESYQATYAKLVQACLAWVQRADRVRAGQPMTNSHLHTFILCKLELSMLEANQIYKKNSSSSRAWGKTGASVWELQADGVMSRMSKNKHQTA